MVLPEFLYIYRFYQNHNSLKTLVIYCIPRQGFTLQEQLDDCLLQLEEQIILKNLGKKNTLKQTFFLKVSHQDEYDKIVDVLEGQIQQFYGAFLPATSFIAQAPENGKHVTMEVFFLADFSNKTEVIYRSLDKVSYTVVQHPDFKEVYAAGLMAMHQDNFYEKAMGSFTLMGKILDFENLNFSDVVRQWNYIENITEVIEKVSERQHYQIFNDVRSSFYRKSEFVNGYPSATGIGMDTGGVVIDFIAVSPSQKLTIKPIKNPGQIDAFEYSEKVLVGKLLNESSKKTSPKFERGKVLQTLNAARIYVSGTAAILGENIVDKKNIEKQTLVTIENIKNLISVENLKSIGLHLNPEKKSFSYIRTYVKHQKDISAVKAICEKQFKSENFQYLVSDICRDDLLVEIEGSLEF